MSISISGNGSITGASTSYSFDQSVSIGGTLTYEDVTNIDSIGVATFRDDVNIGVGGTVAFFDVSTGRIGIGTDSITGQVQIDTISSNRGLTLNAPGNGTYITFETNDTAFGDIGSEAGVLGFGTNDLLVLNARGAKDLAFRTNSSERLRITSDGNIGIGTASPDAALDVVSTTEPQGVFANSDSNGANIRFQNITTGSGQTNGLFVGIDASEKSLIYNYENTDLLFGTNGTERARIDSSGRFAIGTAAPSGTLSVNNASTNCVIEVTRGADGAGYGYTLVGADGATTPALRFQTISNGVWGSEVARFDAAGRLLVGTTSSIGLNEQIQAHNTGGNSLGLGRFANSAGDPDLRFYKSRSGTVGTNTLVQAGDGLGNISFRGANGSGSYLAGAAIATVVEGTPGASSMGCRLVFSTTADGASTPTERMRLNSNGRLLINATGNISSEQLLVYSANSQVAIFKRGNTSGTVEYIRFVDGDNNDCGSIDVDTTANTTAYNTSSDYRLKENVVPLTGAADRVNQLQVHRFNFIADPAKTVDGFLAHEAQEVVPESVTGFKDEVDDEGKPVYQGIDHSKLVPLLTAALQEAITKIETLEQRLADAGIA